MTKSKLEELEAEYQILDSCLTAPSDDYCEMELLERYEEIRKQIIQLTQSHDRNRKANT